MIKKLGFIGAGNVAWHLSIVLNKSGLNIVQVISRTLDSAQKLGDKVSAEFSDSLDDMSKEVDLWIIAIPDDAIQTVCKRFPFIPKFAVHTSGSIALEVLEGKAKEIGVFYPLQTFSKQREVNMQEVPFCIEAENRGFFDNLEFLAKQISSKVYPISSKERRELHLAAVFACNFTNAMYTIAEDLLEQKNLDFEILHPLIEETAQKAIDNSPKEMQTGPAIREDDKTINNHLKGLDNQEYQKLYRLMSDIIKQRNKN